MFPRRHSFLDDVKHAYEHTRTPRTGDQGDIRYFSLQYKVLREVAKECAIKSGRPYKFRFVDSRFQGVEIGGSQASEGI